MLDQFAILGIRATRRCQALHGLLRLNTWTAPELLVLAEALWDRPEREFHYVAVDLQAKHHRQLDLDSLLHLLQLVQRQLWWGAMHKDPLPPLTSGSLLPTQFNSGEKPIVACDIVPSVDFQTGEMPARYRPLNS